MKGKKERRKRKGEQLDTEGMRNRMDVMMKGSDSEEANRHRSQYPTTLSPRLQSGWGLGSAAVSVLQLNLLSISYGDIAIHPDPDVMKFVLCT